MGAIKLVNDQTRMYLILENPTEKEKERLLSIVAEWMGMKEKEKMEVTKPEGVYPAKVKPEAVPVEKQAEKPDYPNRFSRKEDFLKWFKKLPEIPDEYKPDLKQKLNVFISKYTEIQGKAKLDLASTTRKNYLCFFEEVLPKEYLPDRYRTYKQFCDGEDGQIVNQMFRRASDFLKDMTK